MDGGWEAEQVVRRIARCSDRADVAGLVEHFTDDAVLEAGGHTAEGRDAIFTFFGGDRSQPTENERTKHVVTNTIVDVDGDALVTTSYFQVVRSWGLANWGRYVDRFVVDGGVWKVARRTVFSDGSIPRPEPPKAP